MLIEWVNKTASCKPGYKKEKQSQKQQNVSSTQ